MENQILQLVKQADPDNPISYVHNIVKPFAQEKLNNYILNCTDCSICNCKKSITKGNPNASIMIIGESCTEDQQSSEINYPFDNESGQALYKTLDSLNVNLDELFFINSVNCFPYRDRNGEILKRAPTKTERTNCKLFLDYALKIVEPLLIICLGGVAVNGINEEIGKQNITKIRGNYFMYRGIKVMPTFHPGYFLELEKSNRFDEETINNYKWDFYNDIEKAISDLQEQYPDLDLIKNNEEI
jgi:DNA polymerase